MISETTAIVVSYNKRPYTELCLTSLLEAEPIPAQIVVPDNGSEDGSVEYLDGPFRKRCEQAGVEFTLIANEENLGACTARNQALQISTQPYIAFIDNDAAVRTRTWLQELSSVLDANEETGIVGPKLLFPFEPYPIECAGVAISPNGRVKYIGRGEPRTDPEFNEPKDVQCLTSACWLMRRSLCEQLGGLDEIFNPAQFEDFDFCYRAREAGWTVQYWPDSEMYHYENTTTAGSQSLNFKYVTMKNWRTFRKRWEKMYASEGGPPDEECKWAPLETRPLEQTGRPPIL